MKNLPREKYLSRIRPFINDEGLIKVIIGVRRCGKSTILEQIRDELLAEGVPPGNLIHFNLDSRRYSTLETPEQLESVIDAEIECVEGKVYLFIDEVQNINGFERTVNAYREDGCSVFITGSNSYLLSGDLVTKLTGRYVEFDVHPFTLSEIRDFCALNGMPFDPDSAFADYLRFGGYPKRLRYSDEDAKVTYVQSVIRETVRKDILGCRSVRNKVLLEKLMSYLFSTPGAEVSSTSIADYLRSEHIKTQYQTVLRYLDLIYSSKLASKCERFDIIGKSALKTFYKSYVADPSLYSLYPVKRQNLRMGAAIENVVYEELVSRGYYVTVGKLRNLEVDFVVEHQGRIAYVQVAYHMDDPQTEEREEAPLVRIKDCYPKYILCMDPLCFDNLGIRRLNIVHDFLLGDKFVI